MQSLVPQAIGDRNFRMVGATLQRAVVLACVASVVVALLLVPVPYMLIRAFSLDDDTAADLSSFTWYSFLGLPAFFIYFALQVSVIEFEIDSPAAAESKRAASVSESLKF